MKKLLFLLMGCLAGLCVSAQTVIKPFPFEAATDSIIYQNEHCRLVINRDDLQEYFTRLDTALKNNCYSNKQFHCIQFGRLSPAEVQSHYEMAAAYLADPSHQHLQYSTDKFTLFWTTSEGILLPYIEEVLSQLLSDGVVRVVEKSNKATAQQYLLHFEDIDGQVYKLFKLPNGKEIFRESAFFVEQFAHTKS
ncbi:hypothetical protein KTO58_02360 [Chitinophaga pendula]|uniref:hypothetical protein n=1 Tax=Chitinophaga TaxID=79328 RepID=UPI000BB0734B|nr:MULTISPECIES: hypothetical protein [Chitinophaga]ASZ14309.1 hypothetical protein CK934_26855 [Chitinophaga sp. MD30]UCJ08042.1 hypothetical protein KTO58_02360 [Chitinophaga pendula]